MEEIISYIVKNLVNNPEKVSIEVKKEDRATVIKITAEHDDLGKIIGKNGKIITSIRTIAKSLAKKEDGKVIIKVGE